MCGQLVQPFTLITSLDSVRVYFIKLNSDLWRIGLCVCTPRPFQRLKPPNWQPLPIQLARRRKRLDGLLDFESPMFLVGKSHRDNRAMLSALFLFSFLQSLCAHFLGLFRDGAVTMFAYHAIATA